MADISGLLWWRRIDDSDIERGVLLVIFLGLFT